MSQKPEGRSQTKEVNEAKKLEFNKHRAEWLISYINGELPMLQQMHISPDRRILLSDDEQIAMGILIQAGIAGKMMLSALADEEGTEPVHLQKTIIKEKEQILELLADEGYTTRMFPKRSVKRRKLIRLVDDANAARELFAEKNLGLVTMIAGRRNSASNAGSVDFEDLVAEGMNGLMIAIDHFDPSRGNKFSTPGGWWIEQPIRNYLDAKTKTIHMPTHMNNVYKAIYYATKALRDQYSDDRDITDEMIAEYCAKSGRNNITVEKIREAREFRRETISYDIPVGDGTNEKTLAELIESDENIEEGVMSEIGGKANFDRMIALVDDPKKREILRDWYSFDTTQDAVILGAVARKHNVAFDYVKKMKTEAENELREKLEELARTQNLVRYQDVVV